MKKAQLVTRADDAGMNTTVNRAIRAAVKQGIVRNISLMAPAPAIEHAAEALADLAAGVDFGLHVCLTCEWQNLRWGPVSDASAVDSLLLPDGRFPYTCEELDARKPDAEQMMREVEAQHARLVALGFPLAYLDEHMGVGRVSPLADRLAAFAADRGLAYDRGLRDRGALAPLPGWQGPGEHPGTELADYLAGVGSGTYLLIGHPGFKTEEMERLHAPGRATGEAMIARNRQRRMFADIEIVDYCDNGGIRLLRYSQLAGA